MGRVFDDILCFFELLREYIAGKTNAWLQKMIQWKGESCPEDSKLYLYRYSQKTIWN